VGVFYYAVRRIIYAILLLFIATNVIYFVVHSIPGNPYDRIIKEMAELNPKKLEKIPDSHWAQLSSLYGLDKPLYVQYYTWILNVFSGKFGETWSIAVGQDVFKVIMTRAPYTLILMAAAILISLVIAIPAGIYSAVHQYSNGDFYITFLSYFGIAMPNFWFGILMITIFANALGWLPTGGVVSQEFSDKGDILTVIGRALSLGYLNEQISGYEWKILVDGIKHMIMPVVVLSLLLTARWSRFMRSSMLEVLKQDYVRTARAKGAPGWVVFIRHCLRNSLIPLITVVALDIPLLFAGSFIIENVFTWPGIGRLYVESLKSADWPLLHGLLIVNAALIIFANLIADFIYPVIDPRIKYLRAN